MRLVHAALSLAILAATPLTARSASIDFSDGGSHDVTTALGDVTVGGATTVRFLPGGSATGTPGSVSTSALRSNGNSTIDIAGGTLTGATASVSVYQTLFAFTGNVTMSSGVVRGGDRPGPGGAGGIALHIEQAHLALSGGLVRGGDRTTGQGGVGGPALVASNSSYHISGGTVQGGDRLGVSGFGGNAVTSLASSGVITGGTLSAGVTTGSSFLPMLSLRHASTLQISGGLFQTGGRISLEDASVLDVFGTGLVLSGGSTGTTGTLTGTLLDGSAIDVFYSIETGSQIRLNPAAVPEPASCALFGVGALGLAVRRRRRRAANGCA